MPNSNPALRQSYQINPNKAVPLPSSEGNVLRGAANLTAVTCQARQLAICPLSKCRDAQMKFVEVTFKNSSPDIAVVMGDTALADVGGGGKSLRALPFGPIRQTARPGLGLVGDAAVVAVSIGSWAFAGPMFYELITPGQHAKRQLGTAIGEDGSRHEIEASIFGTRVIMPGDETVGWLAFRCPAEDSLIAKLEIPVSFTHSYVPDGSLIVPVAPAEKAQAK